MAWKTRPCRRTILCSDAAHATILPFPMVQKVHTFGLEPDLDYDRSNVHLSYDASRKLSNDVLDLWLDRLAQHLPSQLGCIIDLGCGTGRLTQRIPRALADRFSATVYGVDPSHRMLGVARENVARPDVLFLEGTAEHMPLDDGVADLIFLSMVYHHIHDLRRAYTEFLRVLKPGGHLCIRTSTWELLNTYLWVPFCPGARGGGAADAALA